MTRKCYAGLKCAQETMADIERYATDRGPGALDMILTAAHKWNKDFQNLDPSWKPENDAPATRQPYDPAPRLKQVF